MEARDWDARYGAADPVWGTEPNRFVAQELGPMAPGRVLDVGCGEGRNALWLAARGWHAAGVDFSAVAVERGRQLARQAGVEAVLEVRDVVRDGLPAGPFDAVVLAYLQLPAPERRVVVRAAADVLAPGGTLLVVAHDRRNLAEGTGGPRDP